MYNSQIVTERIRNVAKTKGITMDFLNSSCKLSKNTISNAGKSSEGMKAKNLYMIAECLSVSVDYLLGRTDSPQGISQINTGNVGDNSNVNVHNEKKAADSDDTISELVTEFKNLSFSDKAKVMNLIAELSDRRKEVKA